MLKAIIFDLDDTLYDEETYVSQAFAHTAEYLAAESGAPERKAALYERMLELLKTDGRGKIFDVLCEETGTKIPVGELVRVYRETKPELELYPDAERTLRELEKRKIKTGLITDGCSLVQHAKIEALGLAGRLDWVVVSDDFGMQKPQVEVYEKCLAGLGCLPAEAAYVGDNPGKDFVGARALGMKTFRIVRERGMHMADEAASEREADCRIFDLTELLSKLE